MSVFSKPIQSRAGCKAGFSLLELLTVVGIFAVLAMIAVPAYIYRIPRANLQNDARKVQSTLNWAKVAAATGQRPIRATIDCSRLDVNPNPKKQVPCALVLEQAVYHKNGWLTGWRRLNSADGGVGRVKSEDVKPLNMHAGTKVMYRTAPAPVRLAKSDDYDNLFATNPVVPGSQYGSPVNAVKPVIVMLIMPAGEIITRQSPTGLVFVSEAFGYDKNTVSWTLEVFNTTGQLRLKYM